MAATVSTPSEVIRLRQSRVRDLKLTKMRRALSELRIASQSEIDRLHRDQKAAAASKYDNGDTCE